jgi:hypothetical protein
MRIFSKIYLFLKLTKYPDMEGFFPRILRKFMEQHLLAMVHDSAGVIALPRRLLRNFTNFYFFYNGTKIAYDEKQVMDCVSEFLLALIHLFEEKLSVPEIVKENADHKDACKFLVNNEKILPQGAPYVHMCVMLQYYLLCYNEVYESVQESNLKKLKKFYDVQLLEVLEAKLEMLTQIDLIVEKFGTNDIPYICDLINLLHYFMDLGIKPITSKALVIMNRISIVNNLDKEIIVNMGSVMTSYSNRLLANLDENTVPYAGGMLRIMHNLIVRCCQLPDLISPASPEFEEDSVASTEALLYHFISIMMSVIEKSHTELIPIAQKMIIMSVDEIFKMSKVKPELKGIGIKIMGVLFGLVLDSMVNNETRSKISLVIFSALSIAKNQHIDETENFQLDIFSYFAGFLMALKELMVYLRAEWKANKNIDYGVVQIIMALHLSIVQQLVVKAEWFSDDYDYIVESFKFITLIFVETQSVEKEAFASTYLKVFLLLVEKLIKNSEALNILIQLTNYIISTLNQAQLKNIMANLAQPHQVILTKLFPNIVTILSAEVKKLENSPVRQATTQNTSEAKPAITLKKFGKK